MAQTAQQKATAAVAKAEAKPTPANVAAAAKATAVASGASAKEAKAVVSQVKSQVTSLKDSQALATSALKQEGASKSTLSAYSTAAKSELTSALTGMLNNDFKAPTTVTKVIPTGTTAATSAQARLDAAIKAAGLMNVVPGLAPSGMSATGVSLQSIDKRLEKYDETGTFGTTSLGKTLQRNLVDWAQYRDPKTGLLTLPKEVAEGLGLKEKNGLFKEVVNTGEDGNINRTTQYFKQNADGSFTLAGTDKYNYDDAPEKSGLVSGLLTLASIIPSPLQPFAMGANAVYQASQGNYLSAILSAFGANAAFQGTDAFVLADAKSLADQGLSLSQISDTLGQTYGMNSVANLTNAVGGRLASAVGGVFDSATNTIRDAAGNVIATPDQIATLPVDQVTGGGYTPSYDLNFGTPTNAGGLDLGTGMMEFGTNTGVTGLGTDAATSMYTAQEVFNSFPGAFPSVEEAAKWMVGAGLASTTAEALGLASPGIPSLNTGGTGGGTGGGTTGGGTTTTPTTPPFNVTDPSTYPWKDIFTTGLGIGGSYLTAEQAAEAARIQADAQLEAARIAAEAAKFKPVGVSTRFGQSQFGYDSEGNLTSAGYSLSPDIKAQQDRLIGVTPGLLSQYEGAQAATAPMGTAAQRAMSLGSQYLATDPAAQAKLFYDQQMALLNPSNLQEYAGLQNKLQQQGRLGLSVGGEGGLMATNPEMAAYQNKLEMQQRQLAAASTQGGQQYAQFGAGLVGTGSDLLNSMYGTQAAAYKPYQTAMGGASYLEGLGQQAMDAGVNIGAKGTAASAQAGLLTAQGMNAAAATMAPSNAYSPWGALLTGASGALQNYQQQQQQPQQSSFMYNPYTGARL